jgi:hypothetical protein
LQLVDGEQQDALPLTDVEAQRAYARLEYPVLNRAAAFPMPSAVATSPALPTASQAERQAARGALLRQIIRGERRWTALQAAGALVRVRETVLGWYGSLPDPDAALVRVTGDDISRGFLAYQDDPTALRAWAFLMLAGDFWEFAPDDLSYLTIQVRSGVWDAAFGEPLKADLPERITQL